MDMNLDELEKVEWIPRSQIPPDAKLGYVFINVIPETVLDAEFLEDESEDAE